MVVNTVVNGQINDNILNEVKNCFVHHTKVGRYVATGNPKKGKTFSVYFQRTYAVELF